MGRKIKRILISTMPRSGTVFFFELISDLFKFSKIEPKFTGGFSPDPPEWDPYKFDKTYLSLCDGEVLCAHYHLSEDIEMLAEQPDVLVIYLYRDPRDVAVSAALYIKNVLTHHVLHELFTGLTDSDAIAFMLSGGVVQVNNDAKNGHACIDYEGMKYFCDMAIKWVSNQRAAKVRYEDLMKDPVLTLKSSLQLVGVEIDEVTIEEVSSRHRFSTLSGGRKRGEEDLKSHFRKGVSGDYVNHFTGLHKAICKQRIGGQLIKLGYEKDMFW